MARLRPNAKPQAVAVVGATGSFAAISTLLGSPLLGAFLLMEPSGLGGPMLGPVLVRGLLAAGVGTPILIGLDSLTGLGTASLALPGLLEFIRRTGRRPVRLGACDRCARRLARHRDPAARADAAAPRCCPAAAGGPDRRTRHRHRCHRLHRGHHEDPSDVLFSGQHQLGALLASSAGALLAYIGAPGRINEGDFEGAGTRVNAVVASRSWAG